MTGPGNLENDVLFMKIIREHGGPPIDIKCGKGSAEEFWKEISHVYNSYQEINMLKYKTPG